MQRVALQLGMGIFGAHFFIALNNICEYKLMVTSISIWHDVMESLRNENISFPIILIMPGEHCTTYIVKQTVKWDVAKTAIKIIGWWLHNISVFQRNGFFGQIFHNFNFIVLMLQSEKKVQNFFWNCRAAVASILLFRTTIMLFFIRWFPVDKHFHMN